MEQSVAAPIVARRKAIPAQIKRDVWRRAGGKCEVCSSTYALELEHVKPISLGGGNELTNLRLYCRSCNQRAGIEKLGQQHMDLYLN